MGSLAEAMKMSKSGVFSHFGSQLNLQLAVLKKYHCEFDKQVFQPSMFVRPGLSRLRSLFSYSVQAVVFGKFAGCFYISCAAEYDNGPGPIRNELVNGVLRWRRAMELCVWQAIDLDQLQADTDPEQLVFDIYALILALQHDTCLLEKTNSITRAKEAFERILEQHCPEKVCTSVP
ncbi:TetR/AcrR family transcriptional regulator [Glaciimonas soli]|nr:TetR/AcrR family transcriptional regulator [Glaciimonas soli]